jgi:hypothetical protein
MLHAMLSSEVHSGPGQREFMAVTEAAGLENC